jgi:hypothetical protein
MLFLILQCLLGLSLCFPNADSLPECTDEVSVVSGLVTIGLKNGSLVFNNSNNFI